MLQVVWKMGKVVHLWDKCVYLNHLNMKSILTTEKIFSQTWAKNCLYKIAETEKVTQDQYMHRLKSKVRIKEQKSQYYSEKNILNE